MKELRILDQNNRPWTLLGSSGNKLFWCFDNGSAERLNLVVTDINLIVISTVSFNLQDSYLKGFTPHDFNSCENGDLLIAAQVSYRNPVNGSTEKGISVLRLNTDFNLVWNRIYKVPADKSTGINEIFINTINIEKYVISATGYIFTINSVGDVINEGILNTIIYRNNIYPEPLIYNQKIIVPINGGQGRAGIVILNENLQEVDGFNFIDNSSLKRSRADGFSLILHGDNLVVSAINEGVQGSKNAYLFKIDLTDIQNSYSAIKSQYESEYLSTRVIGHQNGFLHFIQRDNNTEFLDLYDFDLNLLGSKVLSGISIPKVRYNPIFVYGSTAYFFSKNDWFGSIDVEFNDHHCFDIRVNTEENRFEYFELSKTPKINEYSPGSIIVSEILNINTVIPYEYESVKRCPVVLDLTKSTINASPDKVGIFGTLESTIQVKLFDEEGDPIQVGDYQVIFSTTAGEITNYNKINDGIFEAVIIFDENDISATVSFTVNGERSPNTAEIDYIKVFSEIDTAILQSPHIYLQAAGSTGADGSVEGNHLRWAFRNKLGSQHLPKGNYATTEINFNKPDDFVKIYKTPYIKNQVTVDLTSPPQLVDSANHLWRYEVNGNKYHIHFRNKAQFEAVRESVNPLENPTAFIQQYGANLIEVESRNQLAFSAEIITSGSGSSRSLKTELLAVDENKLSAAKRLIARKSYESGDLSNTYQVAENIKSIRFVAEGGAIPTSIKFELYSDLVAVANENLAWLSLGEFALTKDDDTAFSRLEQEANTINGNWPRFTDQAKTNTDNYRDRWNGPRDSDDRNLKDLVNQYISLSDGPNPKSLEIFPAVDEESDVIEDSVELSNFDLLYINSIDYHNARMLGLGTIDAFAEDQKFIYLAEYHTNGNLGDGLGARPVQHLYASLPTGKADQRLPLPVELEAIIPGVPTKDRVSALTNPDGYTPDGKKRFLSLYTSEIAEYENQGFYETDVTFNASDTTTPVYAGISYKASADANWRQPEISSNQQYFNSPVSGLGATAETTPLVIPDPGEALFVHRETESGTHIYKTYGINWFGRIQYGETEQSIETTFQPSNQLLPPAIVNALHVVEEDPLILTSQAEQKMLGTLKEASADDTIVRLLLEYDLSHEIINRKITPEEDLPLEQLLASDTIFRDDDEVFANEIELLFRDQTPQNIQGKVTAVNDHPTEEILSVLTIGDFRIYSSGEIIKPLLPAGIDTENFTGGILVYGDVQFIIYSMETALIDEVATITEIIVYKKQIGPEDQVSTLPVPEEGLLSPVAQSDVIFMAIENMANLNNWNGTSDFKVNIDLTEIHREVIYKSGTDDQPDKVLSKFRGRYDEAVTVSPINQYDEETDSELHKGLYKIDFRNPLAHHSQYRENQNSVDWYGGLVHLHTVSDATGNRKSLKVIKLEGVGTTNPLVVFAIDESFQPVEEDGIVIRYESEDPVLTGTDQSACLYPGYKIYLYEDDAIGLTADSLAPEKGEGIHYTIFGARTVDENYNFDGQVYKSKISTPAIMFTQEINEPITPELPEGPTYATRPDSFGKATFTLSNVFANEPYALIYQRTDNNAILNAIYKPATVQLIKEQISQLTTDAYEASRWQNLLGFEYQYATDDPFNTNGEFGQYPPSADGFRLPNPDGNTLFELINADRRNYHLGSGGSPGSFTEIEAGSINAHSIIIAGKPGEEDTTLTDYISKRIMETFVPLTEIPLLFNEIDETQPSNRKQNIRDRNGALLPPGHPDFDNAPMAKLVYEGAASKVLFTDFTLDGTSDNQYFYTVREMSNTMQMSDYSPVLGPVKLLNTRPPKAPEIVSAYTSFDEEIQKPVLKFDLNAYQDYDQVAKIKLFRTTNPSESLSIRTMKEVASVELSESDNLLSRWSIADHFQDLADIPFGEPLYYRISVDKLLTYSVEDQGMVTEYIPSLPSGLMVSTVEDEIVPAAPELYFAYNEAAADPSQLDLRLVWEKVVHNGQYHIYQLNAQGNWIKIHTMSSNDQMVELPFDQTSLTEQEILAINPDSDSIYHHFRVEAENSSGMISEASLQVTIPGERKFIEVTD